MSESLAASTLCQAVFDGDILFMKRLLKAGINVRKPRCGRLRGWRGPAHTDARRARVDPINTLRQLPKLSRIVPALARARVIRTWSGVEGYLRDDIPVMGPSAVLPGLFYAFGFCGHGFQLGPGVGDMMAELIATGSTATPIEPFHIRRFGGSGGERHRTA